AAQAVEVRAAGLEHRLRGRVVEQCQQQVFDRHVLVARLAGALVALADAVFEILAEHGGSASWSHCQPDGDAKASFPSGARAVVCPRRRGWQAPSTRRSIPAARVTAACRWLA